jgi:hypothetical protein
MLLSMGMAVLLGACDADDDEAQPDPVPVPTQGVFQLNDNGSYCWYQGERAIVDLDNDTMLVSSVAGESGVDAKNRGGMVEVTTYDFGTGNVTRTELERMTSDDHAAPGLLQMPDGRYLAMYTMHTSDEVTHYRVSQNPHDATAWGPAKTFDWTPYSDSNVTYSNLFYLSAEDRIYDFARADDASPGALVSTDHGETWTYLGDLTWSPEIGGYNGYFKYASMGVDRIDFVATEHHPRQYNTSIYAGYLQDDALHLSDGTILYDEAFDGHGPAPAEFSQVFQAGSIWNGEPMSHAWPTDFRLDAEGNPYMVFSCRANDVPDSTNFQDHRFFYARWDALGWHTYQLAKAGPLLFSSEEDYTGLAALVPGNPFKLYISTPIDPRDGKTTTPHYEIYMGMTLNGGETWAWTPVTQGSQEDNIRPLMPVSDRAHQPLIWLRGKMPNFWTYQLEVVSLRNPP